MTESELRAVEERAAAATAGPWEASEGGSLPPGVAGPFATPECRTLFRCTRRNDAWPDAAFVAAARRDVPALCAEVRRLWDLLGRFANDADACRLGESAGVAKERRRWLELLERESVRLDAEDGGSNWRGYAADVLDHIILGECDRADAPAEMPHDELRRRHDAMRDALACIIDQCNGPGGLVAAVDMVRIAQSALEE